MHLLGRKILIIFMRNILLNIVLWVMFISKELRDSDTVYMCPCLGYQRQWRTSDLAKEINHALKDFHI